MSYYLTLEQVCDRLEDGNANYWKVSKDNREKDSVWNTKTIDEKATVKEKIDAFQKYMNDMQGVYIVEWCKSDTPRNDFMNVLNMKINSDFQEDVKKEKEIAGCGSSVYTTELNLRLDNLSKDYEIKDLQRDLDASKKKITSLEDELSVAKKEVDSLRTKADRNIWERVDKFTEIAKPYLVAYMQSKMKVPAELAGQMSGQMEQKNSAEPELNISEADAERFTTAINAWSLTEPRIVDIIEGIVRLKETNPSVYQMALGQLISE